MAKEIINQDELAGIAAATEYDAGHDNLLAALRGRYQDAEFNLAASEGPWSRLGKKAVDREGRVIAADYGEWLAAELSAEGSARAVYDKHKDSGMRLVETVGDTAVIVAPYSPEPDGFLQIEIGAEKEMAERLLFGHWLPPEDLQDLLHPSECAADPLELSPWKYGFKRLTNVRRFIQDMTALDREQRLAEFPELERKNVKVLQLDRDVPTIAEVPFLDLYPGWMEHPMKEVRFLADWQESSAGKSGHRLCDHWWLNLKDYLYQGQRYMSFIPCWTMRDGAKLSRIDAENYPTVYSLMEALEDFHQAAGYPFAWYFYMLHGNKLNCQTGEKVAEGIESGRIGLADDDKRVLLRWVARQYGF